MGHRPVSFHPWRYSNAIWTWSWASCSRWLCLSRRAGPDVLQRSLPTSSILGFCNVFPLHLLQEFEATTYWLYNSNFRGVTSLTSFMGHVWHSSACTWHLSQKSVQITLHEEPELVGIAVAETSTFVASFRKAELRTNVLWQRNILFSCSGFGLFLVLLFLFGGFWVVFLRALLEMEKLFKGGDLTVFYCSKITIPSAVYQEKYLRENFLTSIQVCSNLQCHWNQFSIYCMFSNYV